MHSDGSLDATQTKNVNGALLLPASAGKGDGVYCLDAATTAMPVKNVVATPQVNVVSLGTSDEALVGARGIIPGVPACPAPYVDATVVEVLEEQDNSGPHEFPIPFYAAFNR